MNRRPAPPHLGTDGDWMARAFALRDADWLRNLLTVSGPATEVGRFRAEARGTGAVPLLGLAISVLRKIDSPRQAHASVEHPPRGGIGAR
jgi:hypothetical protein